MDWDVDFRSSDQILVVKKAGYSWNATEKLIQMRTLLKKKSNTVIQAVVLNQTGDVTSDSTRADVCLKCLASTS